MRITFFAVVSLMTQIGAIGMYLALIADFIAAERMNGPVLRALWSTFAATTFVFILPLIYRLDYLTDFIPDMDLSEHYHYYMWFPYVVLIGCQVRLWREIHQWRQQRFQSIKERDDDHS